MCRLKGQTLLITSTVSFSIQVFTACAFLPSQIIIPNHRFRRFQPNHYLPKIFAAADEEDLYQDDFSDFDDDDDDKDDSFSNMDDGKKLLDFAIDSFLRGDYESNFAEDAPAPHPGLTPRETVLAALHSLRNLNDPEPSHGAAVWMRFCVPLSRGERWGSEAPGSFKDILRGALTPTMLARRIRVSQFSCLLEFDHVDVTKGAFARDDSIIGTSSVVALTAALYLAKGPPILVQFMLRKINGVWLIDNLLILKTQV